MWKGRIVTKMVPTAVNPRRVKVKTTMRVTLLAVKGARLSRLGQTVYADRKRQ